MSDRSGVAAENKGGSSLAGQAHLGSGTMGGLRSASRAAPMGTGLGSGLAHACFGRIQELFRVPFLEPPRPRGLEGTHSLGTQSRGAHLGTVSF